MSEQPGLFDEPEVAALPLPRAAKPTKAKVSYTSYGGRADCNDCEQLAFEQAQEGHMAMQPIRRAHVKRTAGSEHRLLCHEHAQRHRELEQTERGK